MGEDLGGHSAKPLSLPIAGRPSLHCAMTGLPGRQAGREARSWHMTTTEGLAAAGRTIAAYRRSDGAATDCEIVLDDCGCGTLGVMDDVWVRMDPRIDGCGPM